MIEVRHISASEYASLFAEPTHAFNSAEFAELNSHKCDSGPEFLLFSDPADGKPRLGLIAGRRGNLLRSPFSAPFGGFEAVGRQNADVYVEAVKALREYASQRGLTVSITLPPPVYENEWGHIAAQQLALMANGAGVECMDFNYSIPLTESVPGFNRRSRSKLNKSLRQGFRIETVYNTAMLREVYNVIVLNHTSLGYPVWMTFDDILATTTLAVNADFFRLSLADKTVAGAMIYHTAPGVCQLIYWGDDPAERDRCPMFMLAAHIIEYYRDAGFREFDLGPASKDGVPSPGLCFFKESIGARLTAKASLLLPEQHII